MDTLKINKLLKNNVVVIVAFIIAIISSIIVKPDSYYYSYIDFRTISTLFCGLAIVTALDRIHVFRDLSEKIVSKFSNLRNAIIALLYITFIGSMIIANDMALITFLPLGFYVLDSTDNRKYMAFTFIMQNIAANLGGMLTPFGNPQNLFMYSYYNIESLEFVSIMIKPFIVSIILITLSCLVIPKKELILKSCHDEKLDTSKFFIYCVLFGLFICSIFRVIPYIYVLLIVTIAIFIVDRQTIIKLDYGLLFTFFFFFIFAGNMSRIQEISDLLSSLLDKNTLLTGVISCQFISNVPSAILLSRFTENYPDLLVAVNIGGAGTLIASLASLITYKEYIKREPLKQMYYLKLFSILNFSFLGILTLLSLFVF